MSLHQTQQPHFRLHVDEAGSDWTSSKGHGEIGNRLQALQTLGNSVVNWKASRDMPLDYWRTIRDAKYQTKTRLRVKQSPSGRRALFMYYTPKSYTVSDTPTAS